MATLLIVNSSPRSNSVSRALTRQYAAIWQAAKPGGRIVERDLSAATIPLLNEEWIVAAYTPEPQRTPRQKELLALSDRLIDEVFAADVILLGVPMHNFFVPAAFKAWIDQIARVGKTFAYSEQGPQGLIPTGKKAIAVLTRGGVVNAGQSANDALAAYLRQILGFVGLTDVTIVHADRQGMGNDAAAQSVSLATQSLLSLAQAHPTLQAA